MEEAVVLSAKLNTILDKLKKDLSTLNQDKLQHVFHSVHTISWIVIQSIVPYIDEHFRSQTVRTFQLITQMLKSLKELDFEDATERLFQFRSQRSRSLKLINCSMCDEYRKLPQRANEKQYYANYISQLKKDQQKAEQLKQQQFGTVLKSDEKINELSQVHFSCQVDLIVEQQQIVQQSIVDEQQAITIELQEQIQQLQQQVEQQQQQQQSQQLPASAVNELNNHFTRYYQLLEQYNNLKATIEEAATQCQTQEEVIKSVKGGMPAQQLKHLSTQSIQQINKQLMKPQVAIELTKEFSHRILQESLPKLKDIQRQVMIAEHQRKALEAGIIDYDPEFDPALLVGQRMEFRIRLVDGETKMEEVVVDIATGNVMRSRIRDGRLSEQEELIRITKEQQEDMHGDDNQWIFEKYGDKVKIVDKQQQFSQYEVNMDPTKKKVKVTKDKDGQVKLEEEWISKQVDGKQAHHKVYQSQGQVIYEERVDNTVNRWQTKQQANREAIHEEIITEDGIITKILEKEKYGQDVVKIIKRNKQNEIIHQITKQVLKDEDGETFQQEEEAHVTGERIVRKIYIKQVGDEYQKVIETSTHPNGGKQTMNFKKYQDKTEITYVDEYGDTITVVQSKYLNEQGQMIEQERKFNMTTKELTITKQFKNSDGRLTVESVVTLDGVEVMKSVIVHVGPNEKIMKITKDNQTIEQRVVMDENGQEKIFTNDNQMNIQTTNFTKGDVDYSEKVISLPNGAKRQVARKSYYDGNQDRIEEEDRIDEFGQKTVVRKRINMLGEEIIEEFEIVESNDQTFAKQTKVVAHKMHKKSDMTMLIDEFTQTEGVYVQEVPLDSKDDEPLQFASQTLEPFPAVKKQGGLVVISQPDFNEIDNEVFNKYKNMKKKNDPQFNEAVLLIKRYFNKGENDELKQEEFQEYLQKYRSNHGKCGEQCSHLLRFYAKLGFLIQKTAYNRQTLKLQRVFLHAKEQQQQQQQQQQQ